MSIRNRANSAWALFLAMGFTLTACGQNPHVLGVDPSLNQTSSGPTPFQQPGQPVPPTTRTGDPGQKTPGKGKECYPKDGEFQKSYVQEFHSRALRDGEGLALDPTVRAYAMDIALESHITIREIRDAWLNIPGATPESESRVNTAVYPEISVCLLHAQICGTVGLSRDGRLHLTDLLRADGFLDSLHGGEVLRWLVPVELGATEVVMQLDITEDSCTQPGHKYKIQLAGQH